jgi:predicted Ser/Thr protein kinase
MAQKWYIQFDDRTVGPITSRKLQKLALDGELTSGHQVSLDNENWFRASKVLGLFPEGSNRRQGAGDVPKTDPGDEDEITIKLDPDEAASRGIRVGPSPVDDAAAKIDRNGASDPIKPEPFPVCKEPSEEAATLVVTRPGESVDRLPLLLRLAKGTALLGKNMAVPLGKIAYRVLRATVIAATLASTWAIRTGYGLLRRRRIERTAFETRLASSIWTRPGESGASASRPEPLTVTLPEQFGRYRIVRLLGRGGMGSVYLAHDGQLDRSVALKVPHFTPEDGPEILDRFYREARSAATLEHPNVCPIFDVGQIDGHHYVSMAFIEGRPLADLVEADKRLSQRQAAILVRQLAMAMAEAHRRGIIHRDLKPANIMINPRHEPVIMDFGLARRSDKRDARLTKSGAIVGTPAYMPPEQVKGDPAGIGPGCDIYSLGVVLYELLTCHLPFEGPTLVVLGQILTQEPPPPSSYCGDIDTQLEAICLKAMAKKVEDRYASMVEMVNALGRFLRSGTPAAASDDDLSDDVVSWSGFFALPPRKATGIDPTDWPAGSAAGRGHAHPWPWVAVAAVLVAALVYLATSDRATRVEVQLAGIQVTNQTINNYYLDGKPFTERELKVPIGLMTGEHELRMVLADGKEETRTFTVVRGDNRQTVDINRPDLDASPDVRPLASALLSDSGMVRKDAAERLKRMNDTSAVPDLIKRVADDKWIVDDWVGAFYPGKNNYDPIAGGKSAALEALKKLAPDKVDLALGKAIKSRNQHVSAWAASQYGQKLAAPKGSTMDSSQALVERIADEAHYADFEDKNAALQTLQKQKPERVTETLLKALKRDDLAIKSWAARKLETLGDKSAVPALVERIADEAHYAGFEDKDAALQTLRKLDPGQVEDALQRAMNQPDLSIKTWAATKLGEPSRPKGK